MLDSSTETLFHPSSDETEVDKGKILTLRQGHAYVGTVSAREVILATTVERDVKGGWRLGATRRTKGKVCSPQPSNGLYKECSFFDLGFGFDSVFRPASEVPAFYPFSPSPDAGTLHTASRDASTYSFHPQSTRIPLKESKNYCFDGITSCHSTG
jgi:hypothetical protein